MDRSIARLLDRPFNIAEHDIDVGLPFDYQEPHQNYPDERTEHEGTTFRTSIAAFIPVIRLIRLKSQIQTRVHRVDKEVSLLMPEINPLFSALEEYKRSLQSDLSPIDHDWINMHWHNGILILIQPFLRELPSDHELIRTCMRASGQTCQPCSIDVANDLGACSSVLFAIAERNKQLEKYRDTWEAILTKVMEHLEKVSSSNETHQNIIHQRSPSNPFTPLSMDSSGSGLLATCADLPFLNNLDFARGQKHQDPWTISPADGLMTEGTSSSNPHESFKVLKGLYPEWQEDPRQPCGSKHASKFDEIMSGNYMEERRPKLPIFEELFGNPE
ncbi:hypothetical protein N7486_004234 [Penicillium sp. IBT 16267x]|nr:hypothetical protein N7486_004234 [Penicillium sp. IBT 16267x]